VIVPNRLTALDAREAGRALFSAYAAFTGRAPSDQVGALLLAQSALETGNWQKIHNYNFGNIKARADYPTITQFRCSEIIDGVERFFDPPDPHCNFRAYGTASEGALDYLKVLHGEPHWWQGLQAGDPGVFVDALATPPKYFTADPTKYKRTLTALFEQFRPLVTALLGQANARATALLAQPAPRRAPPVSTSPVSSSGRPSSLGLSTTGPSGGADRSASAALKPRGNGPSAAAAHGSMSERHESNASILSGERPGPSPNETNRPSAMPTTTAAAPKGDRDPIRVVEDTATAVAVVAHAAEVIASTATALPASSTAGQAAAVVRVVRWLAQFINWLLAALRLRRGATKKK
jgi:hypothetical protein